MLQAVQTVHDPATPPGMRVFWPILWAPLFVEAVTATAVQPAPGSLDRAGQALDVLDSLCLDAPALVATCHWLHGRLAAASGDTGRAYARYQQALASPAPEGDDIPLHRAFARHDLARLLQTGGDGDRAESAAHLQHALRTYTALGATPFIQRTSDELGRLTGQPQHSPTPADSELTDREQAVADLAARGHTNQEIASELFLSPKTIEYHLGHIYTKLHLTGRRQLRGTLHSTTA
jgi:DNA-binding CsgD family transcriptional regulator